ncbi:MAG: DUF1365 domain-containing protein [Anaeromyxobacteraceae bacterium]
MSAGLASCLYEGTVQHRRRAPTEHALRYRVFMVMLDLGELDRVFAGRWLWSIGRPNLAAWRREDHLGDPARPLDEAVRDLVEQELGRRPAGPVRLLTHLRYFGYGFNPVSFYYCFAADGALDAIVGEVNNTPWNERHPYVLDARSLDSGPALAGPTLGTNGGRSYRFKFPKAFHVSPFMGMAQTYDWRFSVPGDRLAVHMDNLEGGRSIFDATLALERRPMTGLALASVLLRFPAMTAKVIAAIYWNALLLWWKRTPYHEHPAPKDATS